MYYLVETWGTEVSRDSGSELDEDHVLAIIALSTVTLTAYEASLPTVCWKPSSRHYSIMDKWNVGDDHCVGSCKHYIKGQKLPSFHVHFSSPLLLPTHATKQQRRYIINTTFLGHC